MSDSRQRFGERLYSELRQLSGYDLITGIMNYNTIQQLKMSDREGTLKLFRGSSYEVIQLLKTGEPEEVARYLVTKAGEAKKNYDPDFGTAILIAISSL
ncbi:hypothetical protein FYK55_27620 [Roseiconus nitratireducens]|uniref:Uncharacterized protein n=1 Tax=Roseiconus nitratireducens TaxID=2605748 RepID=A0A5M6CWZ5_9BACT|nr:hypothetical protein [Roseiconus nitratireducens]KAA5538512.1 hypothetical protein FYK55_27620 [Roseiconus nitratireducens]